MRFIDIRVDISAHLGFASPAGLKPYETKEPETGCPLERIGVSAGKTCGMIACAGETGSCDPARDQVRATFAWKECLVAESNDMVDPDC